MSGMSAPPVSLSNFLVEDNTDISVTGIGSSSVISLGEIFIPDNGKLIINFAGKLVNNEGTSNQYAFGIKIGATYYFQKVINNGTVYEGYIDSQTRNGSVIALGYHTIFSSNTYTSDSGRVCLDIPTLAIPAGLQTVEFAVGCQKANGFTFKGTEITSQFSLTVEAYE